MNQIMILIFICLMGWLFYEIQNNPVIAESGIEEITPTEEITQSHSTFDDVALPNYMATDSVQPNYTVNEVRFRCDGRQYCSQMNSCEEAMFFINNCPNTKMDGDYGEGEGDGDGIPCERQHCGY